MEGILQVSALDTNTQTKGSVSIAANIGRLYQDEIAGMMANAEKCRKQDEARVKRLESVNELDRVLSEIADSKVGNSVRARANKVRESFDEEGGRDTTSAAEIEQRMSEIYNFD
jgi:molecular chaperone DnaK (HSP70)